MSKMIIEKVIGIKGDYQYKAIRSKIWPQRFWHKNKFEILKQLVIPDTSKTVLDLGTGSGNFEILFSSNFKQVTGVDYNDEALGFLRNELRKRNINNTILVKSDIRNLPLKVTDRKYDYIILVDVIEHVYLRETIKLVQVIHGMLNPGGKIIIITPNYESLWPIIENISDLLSLLPKFGGKQHLSKFTPKSLSYTLVNQGFKSISIKTFNLFSFLSPFKNVNKLLLNTELNLLGNFGCLICASGTKE